MKYLFIGGDSDGKRIDVLEDRERVQRTRTLYAAPVRVSEFSLATSVPFETEIYVKHRFRGAKRYFDVFAVDGLTPDDILYQLINNYNK